MFNNVGVVKHRYIEKKIRKLYFKIPKRYK